MLRSERSPAAMIQERGHRETCDEPAHLPRLRRPGRSATTSTRTSSGRSAAPTPRSSPRRAAASRSARTTACPRRASRPPSSTACARPASTSSTSACTTPILYFATAHWKIDGGANITGSHNPIEYNGVKMVHAGAAPLTEDEIQSLRTGRGAAVISSRARRAGRGAPREDYFETVLISPRPPLKVVVDAGNGIAGVFAPDLLRRIGCEVIEQHCESDGRFPHHLPDPEDEKNVATSRPGSSRSGPISAWPTTATLIAWGSSTSWPSVTRPISSWSCWPATCSPVIPAPGSCSTSSARSRWSTTSRARRRAGHVEDRPLAPQAQDARGWHPARGRGERPHVLRRELPRRRRRILASAVTRDRRQLRSRSRPTSHAARISGPRPS